MFWAERRQRASKPALWKLAPQNLTGESFNAGNISESRLPPGSEVQFVQQSMWEQYRSQTIGALGILFVQSAMITWLLVERSRRFNAEVKQPIDAGKSFI